MWRWLIGGTLIEAAEDNQAEGGVLLQPYLSTFAEGSLLFLSTILRTTKRQQARLPISV